MISKTGEVGPDSENFKKEMDSGVHPDTLIEMDDALVERARSVSADLLRGLPRRWAHVQGVAARASAVVGMVDPRHADEIVAACWLHDVGYAPDVASTGFHPVDGAQLAQDLGFSPLVVSLVAHHTGAVVEAAVRGLSAELAAFAAPPTDVLDVVTFADLTTSVDGEPIGADERIAEILARYPVDDPVHRAMSLSAPGLLDAVARVTSRVPEAGGESYPR